MAGRYCCIASIVLVLVSTAGRADHTPQVISAGARERPHAPSLSVSVGPKELRFSWTKAAGTRRYKLLHNPDGSSGYLPLAPVMSAHRTRASVAVGVHLRDWERATYLLAACNQFGCTNSNVVQLTGQDREALDKVFAPANRLAMSADGQTLVAAHRNHSDEYVQSGAVFIYRKWNGTWRLEQTLEPPQPGDVTYFGWDVALSADGRTLAVGGNTEDVGGEWPRASAVFLYSRIGRPMRGRWAQTAKLVPPGASVDDWTFGLKLDMSTAGDVLLVGSPADNHVTADTAIESAGSAFVFRRQGHAWLLETQLTSPEPEAWDQFGAAVSVSGSGKRIVVLAGEENDLACNYIEECGDGVNTLHTFRFDGAAWVREDVIEAAEGYSWFGGSTSDAMHMWQARAVELDWAGTTLAVGVLGLDSDGGAILIYRRDERAWTVVETLRPPPDQGPSFGNVFALSPSGRVLVARTEDRAQPYGRKRLVTFVRDRSGWSLRSNLDSPAPGTFYDAYGEAIATNFSGSTVAVSGARFYPDPSDLNVWTDVVYLY